jgi:hypothetical protein
MSCSESRDDGYGADPHEYNGSARATASGQQSTEERANLNGLHPPDAENTGEKQTKIGADDGQQMDESSKSCVE